MLAATACGEPARPGPGPGPARPDKAALFGDPTLVPTRDGERSRRELALAHEVEQAARLLSGLAELRVNVELPPRRAPEGRPRVLAVIRPAPGTEDQALREQVTAIARAVVDPRCDPTVLVSRPAAQTPPVAPSSWPLVLSVLGLGFCGGLLAERARALRAPRRRRP